MTFAWSARRAELPPAERVRLAARRRALGMCCRAVFAAALVPALRLRAEPARAALTPKSPFGAGSLGEVLRLLDAHPAASDDLSLVVPDFVENGALVPVEITSRVPGAQDIYIISETNPFPLVARFSIPDGTEAFVSTRIKVASSGNVHALVQTEDRWLSTVKATTVTVGGCGA